MTRRPSALSWVVAAAVVGMVAAAVAAMRPVLGPDSLPGLLALEQRRLGVGNSMAETRQADPADLAVDHFAPISWWPPGQQMLVSALRGPGQIIGNAVKRVVWLSWTMGTIGWSVYFWLAFRDKRLVPWFIGAFALYRASHAGAFEYPGAEPILWGVFPLVALLNLAALRAPRQGALWLAGLAGSAVSLLVILKYTGAILLLGFGTAWLYHAVSRDISRTRLAAWVTGVLLGGAVAYVNVAPLIRGSTPASVHWGRMLGPALSLGIAGPLMPASDVIDAVMTVTNRAQMTFPGPTVISLLALGVTTVFLLWLFTCYTPLERSPLEESAFRRSAWRLGVSVAVVTSVVLAILLIRGAGVSWEDRHRQYGAFLLLPFLVESLYRTTLAARGLRRVIAGACAFLFVVFPVTYGAAGLANKVFIRTPALRNAYGPTGVLLYWTADVGAAAFHREMESLAWFRSAVLVTPAPNIALSFPDKRLLIMSGLAPIRGRPAGGVALFAPPWFDASLVDGLKSRFTDIHQWTKVELTCVPSVHLWRGE